MRNKNKKNIIKQRNKKLSRFPAGRLINKLIIIMIIISGAYYIIGANDLSIKGFVLNDLKTRADALAKENQDIETQVMRLESYDQIAAKSRELKMVAVERIEYITIVNGEVAKK